MPREKDLKRLVRARMKKTGEAYTAARVHVLKKSKRTTRRAATPPARLTTPAAPRAPLPKDYAGLAGMSDAAISAKTGRTWAEWAQVLDGHHADKMAHSEIAMLVSSTYKVQAWWTQTVTVGYERIKGLRARGQRRNGTYEATKSRTFNVPVATLFDAWADPAIRRRWLNEPGVKLRTATAPKSLRLGWSDGSIIAVWFTPKGAAKSSVAVTQVKLTDRETVTRVKQEWTERLDALARELAE